MGSDPILVAAAMANKYSFNCYLPLPQVLMWTLSCNCGRKAVAPCERTLIDCDKGQKYEGLFLDIFSFQRLLYNRKRHSIPNQIFLSFLCVYNFETLSPTHIVVGNMQLNRNQFFRLFELDIGWASVGFNIVNSKLHRTSFLDWSSFFLLVWMRKFGIDLIRDKDRIWFPE